MFSESGASKFVNSMRMLMEAKPEFVMVKCDIQNAFNSISQLERQVATGLGHGNIYSLCTVGRKKLERSVTWPWVGE